MKDQNKNLWPFQPRFSLLAVPIVLVALLTVVAGSRAVLNWPSSQSDNIVLIGVLVLCLLPIALAILDVIIERGGVLEYKGVRIDFSRSKEKGTTGFVIAANIGVRGQPVTDSSTSQILETLREATNSDLVVIDIEDGHAWWETRLLVLLAGAVRLKKPDKIVFVGKDANIDYRFQGWAYAAELLPRLLAADPQYPKSLQAAWAAARQWELIEPLDVPAPVVVPAATPAPPPWLSGRLATSHSWMAFDQSTGLHNELFAEQLLQSDLGQKIEAQAGPVSISLARLEDLFCPVLKKESIDLDWPVDRQQETFMNMQTEFVALTTQGKYSALVSRQNLLNEVLRSVLARTKLE